MEFMPWMVTVVPTCPLAGLKLVIVGTPPPPVTLKFVALVAVPVVVESMVQVRGRPGRNHRRHLHAGHEAERRGGAVELHGFAK